MISTLFNLFDPNALNYVDKCASICILIYNSIKCKTPCYKSTDGSGTNVYNLTATINYTSKQNGYYLEDDLMNLINIKLDIISKSDFGITLLMMFFAKYNSVNQYEIFVYTFRCIDEFENFEMFLLSLKQRTIKLPTDMATDENYGLLRNKSTFINSNYLTIKEFEEITNYMKSVNVTSETFISIIKHLHISIIESFFMFTSIYGISKTIEDCHKLLIHQNHFKYKFPKIIKTSIFDGDYWFTIPPNAKWFCYNQGKTDFIGFVNTNIINLMKVFDNNNINCIVVGIIHNNVLYPLYFENENMYCQWGLIIKKIKDLNMNCIFKQLPIKCKSRIYYVKNGNPTIFLIDKMKENDC